MADEFKFELGRNQANKISREKMITELGKAAKHFNYVDFKQTDFDKVAGISNYTVYREFGSWEKALLFLAEHLKKQGINFNIATRRESYSEQEMFVEMERIWRMLEHRPSRDEWTGASPTISYDTLYRHFGGWTNACLKFIEYKSGENVTEDSGVVKVSEGAYPEVKLAKPLSHKPVKTRTIPLSLRVKVLSRDKFRCVYCGKSPATDAGTILHIDHIKPFSKGGESTLDNLQTLCQDCNLGKSNDLI
jgi:hypothetical protein